MLKTEKQERKMRRRKGGREGLNKRLGRRLNTSADMGCIRHTSAVRMKLGVALRKDAIREMGRRTGRWEEGEEDLGGDLMMSGDCVVGCEDIC